MLKSSVYPVLVPNKPAEALGDFYWPMSQPAANRYAFRGAAYQHARTDTAITLEIGDTVTFTYDSNGSKSETCYFIHSGSGADNVGYAGHDSSGDLVLSSFTATMDGEPLLAGEQIWNSNTNTDMKFHTIELTATARTDFRHIGSMGDGDLGGSGNGGTGNIVFAMIDFTVVTSGQTYNWPMRTYNSANQVESNSTGNDITINSHQTTRWVTVANEPNQGTGEDWQLRTSDPNSGDNLTSEVASLRADGTGKALGFLSGTEYMRALEEAWTNLGNVDYSNGFTVEVLVRYKGSANSDSRACGVVSSFNNVFTNSLWLLGFDNFDDATNADSVRPVFTLLGRDTIYSDFNNYSSIEGEIRSSTDAVVDGVYQLLATVRPSDDTAEFWVNSVSVGTISIDPAWYGTLGVDSLLDGSIATYLNIGPRFLNGAWRSGQLSEIQDLKIHLLEANQAFADRQYSGGILPDLGDSSGVTPGSVNGLYTGTTITARHPAGDTRVMELGTTRNTDQEAERVGTEPYQQDIFGYPYNFVSGQCTLYTEDVIAVGTKMYVEFVFDVSTQNNMRYGLSVEGREHPGILLGTLSNEFGFTDGGFRSLNNPLENNVALRFDIGDILSLAVDYSVLDEATVHVYINGIKQYERTLSLTSHASGKGLRPTINLDRGDAANAYGDTARILTHQGVQTYAPPATYTALET